jgi:hypothetical protein
MVRRAALGRSTALFTAAIVACAGVALPALAQGDADRAGARAAASEGLKAFEAGRWAEALDLFTRAESLVHAPPHLLYMARAQQQLHHLVEAHEIYMRIKNENITPDRPAAFQSAQANAIAELSVLEPTIPSVKVVVNGAPPNGVSVLVDGAAMSTALIGIPHPIDPGPHTFLATATGLRSAPSSVNFQKAQTITVTLDLKPSDDARPLVAATPTAPPVLGPATPPPAAVEAPRAPPPVALAPATSPTTPESHIGEPSAEPARDAGASHGTSPLRIASIPAFGLAAVGVGIGVAFLVVSQSKESDANALCTLPGGVCPYSSQSQVNSLDSSAKGARTLSIVGFAVGGAALATGAILFVAGGNASGGSEHAASPLFISPWVGWASAGLNGVF